MIRSTAAQDDELRAYLMQTRHPRPADDPCPAYVTIEGPRDTRPAVVCVGAYGHGDPDPEPLHVGRITVRDRNGQPVRATVTWCGR